jgi:hypothetical protein
MESSACVSTSADFCSERNAMTRDESAVSATEPTIDQLKAALRLAVNMLSVHEPPDSRAVSDEFVALACVDCGDTEGRVMEVIEAALALMGVEDAT